MGPCLCLDGILLRSQRAGSGIRVRVSPNHFDDPLNRPCNALLKWAGPKVSSGWLVLIALKSSYRAPIEWLAKISLDSEASSWYIVV